MTVVHPRVIVRSGRHRRESPRAPRLRAGGFDGDLP